MKNYLNRQEQLDLMALLTLVGYCEDIVSGWDERGNLAKEERRNLLTARTLVKKASKSIVDRLEPAQAAKLLRTADSWTVMCAPKESANNYRKRIEEENKDMGIWCSEDALCGMAEMALTGSCCPCIKPEEERSTCLCRHAFTELGIPVFNENPADGICPYDNRLED